MKKGMIVVFVAVLCVFLMNSQGMAQDSYKKSGRGDDYEQIIENINRLYLKLKQIVVKN